MLTLLSPAQSLDFSPAPAGLRTTEPRFGEEIGLLDFAEEGHGFRRDLSTEERLVFTRAQP